MFKLDPLPYSEDALEPHIDSKTVNIHYGKHHRGYVNKLNDAAEKDEVSGSTLEEVIQKSEGSVFNWASQIWNHDFYWRSMNPSGGGEPPDSLRKALDAQFGTVDKFRAELAKAAKGEFGSGWAWLAKEPSGDLRVCSSSDAESPLQRGATPLVTIDVWEHAYYLDYQNERGRYVDNFIKHLIDWDFVARNLDASN